MGSSSGLTAEASTRATQYLTKANAVEDPDLKGQFTELSARYAELAAKQEGLPVPKAFRRQNQP